MIQVQGAGWLSVIPDADFMRISMVRDGDEAHARRRFIWPRFPRENHRRPRTSPEGLPRVVELFEARKPP